MSWQYAGTCKWYAVCPIKHYTEQGKLSAYWVQNYCLDKWRDCVRYHMEERGEYHPDCMLPDGSIAEDLRRH